MFGLFKKVMPKEEPQDTNGKIVLRVDSYKPYETGFHVYFSFIRDGEKMGNDSIFIEGPMGDSYRRIKNKLKEFIESRNGEPALKNLIGKPIMVDGDNDNCKTDSCDVKQSP